MTSWRKFKKQYKKDSAKRIYGHLLTLTDRNGKVLKGTFRRFKPRLEEKPNGRKRVVLDFLVDDLVEEVAERSISKADSKVIEDEGSLSFNFTVKSKDVSDTLKKMFGL